MHYLIDTNLKIIFGWSPKCGCSHIKRIFKFFKNDISEIHTRSDSCLLPKDITKYTTIVICRNPYKRLVSGFLDKYSKNGQFKSMWKLGPITFSAFVDQLSKHSKMIEPHHFLPQTSERFNIKILKSDCIKFYDIESIDYTFLESLYNKQIPDSILGRKEGHERKTYSTEFTENVSDLDMDIYFDTTVNVNNFYTPLLKKKVYEYYKKDFEFFKQNGFDYNNLVI